MHSQGMHQAAGVQKHLHAGQDLAHPEGVAEPDIWPVQISRSGQDQDRVAIPITANTRHKDLRATLRQISGDAHAERVMCCLIPAGFMQTGKGFSHVRVDVPSLQLEGPHAYSGERWLP